MIYKYSISFSIRFYCKTIYHSNSNNMTDLTQSKLSRVEWDSIEIPESDAEKQILQMIIQGYSDVNVRKNDTLSMFAFIKIEMTAENELYLYKKYFHPHQHT